MTNVIRLFGLLILVFTFSLSAQTYRTINIDGINDFNLTNEKFSTSSIGYFSYITWDSQFLYLGYEGNDVGSGQSSNKWIIFYIDTDPQQTAMNGTGTTSAIGFNTQNWSLPFSANYMIQIRTDEGENKLNQYNGSGWNEVSPNNIDIYDNNSTNYIEIKVPLSKIGNPKQINILSYFINAQAFNEWTYGANPSNSISDGYKSSGTFTTFYNFYLIDKIIPNDNYYLNNYHWFVRLSVSNGTLKDTTAWAGMSVNATDGFDEGIDLPKPPEAPSNYLSIYFPQASWESNLGPNYMRDIKEIANLSSSTSIWNFAVSTDQTNSNITLSADNFDFVPSNYNILIKDLTANETYDIKNSDYQYTSSSSAEERFFELIIGVSLTNPTIVTNKDTVNYGTLKTNQDSTAAVILTNTGQTDLEISNILLTGTFYSYNGPTSKTLAENDTMHVKIKFAPKAAGSFNGNIKILSNDPENDTLNIILLGQGQTLTSTINVSTNSLNFGSVKLGNDSTLSLYVSNSGDTTLAITNITSTNSVFTVTSSTTLNINSGDSSLVNIKFTPNEVNNFNGTLTFTSSAVNSEEVSLSGSSFVLSAVINASDSSLNFGNIKVDYDTTVSVLIFNTGDTTLVVSNVISSNSVFTLTTVNNFVVDVNDTTTVTIKFSPLTVSSYDGTLKFISNSADTLTIELTGNGITNTVAKTFSAGWNLISIPIKPVNPTPAAVIGDDISTFFLYGYSSGGGYQNVDTLKIGRGYWLGIETGATIDVTGTAEVNNYSYSLNNGWNIVSSPFIRSYPKSAVTFTKADTTVNADSASSLGWVQNVYYGYSTTGSNYFSEDTLEQWNGYWFAALQNDININFTRSAAGNTPLKISPELDNILNINNWYVNIEAVQNGRKDNLLVFGVKEDATDGFDSKYDAAKPPVSPASNALQTYFGRNDWHSLINRFAADIKAPYELPAAGKSWNFSLFVRSAGVVTLSWNEIINQLPDELKNNYTFTLSGDQIPVPVNMLTTTSININGSGNSTFQFIINSSITNVNEVNKIYTFNIEQNYPNPFNPSTVINYQLASLSKVELKVYDLLGNEVTSLISDYKEAGSHSVIFDATGLSSGVYYYRISAIPSVKNEKGYTETKKMIFIK